MSRASASLLTRQWGSAASSIRMLIRGVTATLVLFHACLFLSQIARGDLADPGLALRWIGAGALVTTLVTLWRRGDSLVGRKAVAVWALAALLHGPALGDRQARVDNLVLPEAIASVLLIAGTGTGLSLLLVTALTRRHRLGAPAFISVPRHDIPRGVSRRVAGPSCAARPPPRV